MNKRKEILLAICGPIGVVVAFGAFAALSFAVHPEQRIQGTWEEVAWSYEKADLAEDSIRTGAWFDEQLRHEVSKGLLIHESETWCFAPAGALALHKKATARQDLQWKLKGRGHILELVYADSHREAYQVRRLTEDEMVLQFNSDLVARGIVKILFRKVNHAC